MQRSPAITLLAFLIPAAIFPTAPRAEDPAPVQFQRTQTAPGLSLHKDMYMLPITASSEYRGSSSEAVFRLSAKHRLFKFRLYFAYTQISFWQAYDAASSAPFRETNYNPEMFYRFATRKSGPGIFGADLGFEHESNGQVVGPSRSWNLLYLAPYYQWDRVLLYVKLRYRIPEAQKETPDSPIGDDNPDIMDYYGYADLHLYWVFLGRHYAHFTLRGNIRAGKGGGGVTYNYPFPYSDNSYVALQVTHGYGETLVDYRMSLTRFGIGVMFTR